MTNVKKAYVELIAILEANSNEKVSAILPQILELCQSKGSGVTNTVLKNDTDEVYAVFCYYHKKWELIDECEYGAKKSTASGLNTMCKEGVSNWTKQQRIAKQAKVELLDSITNGELLVEDLSEAQEAIEEARTVVVPRLDSLGFETEAECFE